MSLPLPEKSGWLLLDDGTNTADWEAQSRIKCDWINRNHSKSHIGSYEIIDFKDFKAL